jgi:hypothetical protein
MYENLEHFFDFIDEQYQKLQSLLKKPKNTWHCQCELLKEHFEIFLN